MTRRPRGYIVPLLLIAVGVVALLANFGALDWDAVAQVANLWPLLLVWLGLEILLSRTLPAAVAGPVMLLVLVVGLAAAIGYAALLSHGGRASGPFPIQVRTLGAVQTLDRTVPLQGVDQGNLRVDFAAARIDVRGDSLGDDLLRTHLEYPDADSPPSVRNDGGNIRIEQGGSRRFRFVGPGRRTMELRLNKRVPWTIRLEGGAANITLDLGDLELSRLEVAGGASRLDLRLPSPKGLVRIDVSGGALSATVHLPRSAAARVTLEGGANSLSVSREDGRRFGRTSWETPGFGNAADRFEISVSGGANHIRIE